MCDDSLGNNILGKGISITLTVKVHLLNLFPGGARRCTLPIIVVNDLLNVIFELSVALATL
jgi:hypothetical protein